ARSARNAAYRNTSARIDSGGFLLRHLRTPANRFVLTRQSPEAGFLWSTPVLALIVAAALDYDGYRSKIATTSSALGHPKASARMRRLRPKITVAMP
ncbi:MAG TPA: hypothetical protein VIM28_00935, partial [Solirubrobacterales bacterium]